jgi:hypothetical protein
MVSNFQFNSVIIRQQNGSLSSTNMVQQTEITQTTPLAELLTSRVQLIPFTDVLIRAGRLFRN